MSVFLLEHDFWFKILLVLTIVGLIVYGSLEGFLIVYAAVLIFSSARMFFTNSKWRAKFAIFLVFIFVFVIQVLAAEMLLYPHYSYPIYRGICAMLLVLPLIIGRYVVTGQYSALYLPPLGEFATLSFAELVSGIHSIPRTIDEIKRTGKGLSIENIKSIAKDLPRHNSFQYVNNGSLTETYFNEAQKNMSDTRIYIVISNTGSPASEIISVFTRKQYNHASLSFDRELKTIISYNGGERVYPPGLNPETLDYFNKKSDSSIIVYSLSCTKHQKQKMLDKVKAINEEGSAYNLMGLLLKHSRKPNIMYCSQFIYKILDYAGLSYFVKNNVSPTDLVEQDYRRKLQFEYEMFFDRELE
ncbi:MAG: hypothetical protein FWG65_09390 [Turicibacter sp.]|nr:hypothetical protein [Turicibacter sp.]